MRNASKNCILFFVKDPVAGKVKSRLAAELDDTTAVELYKNFILDMLPTLDKCAARRMICVHPQSTLGKFRKWLGTEYLYLPQVGNDLGERMKNSFIKTFNMEYEQVILIGSDIPDLPRIIITEAFQMLETHDAVVGPARDGGYYLIGFRNDSFVPGVFDTMKWCGKAVLRSTFNRLQRRGCRVHLLPAWSDVDTVADLLALLQRNKSRKCTCPKTISYLSALSLRHKTAGRSVFVSRNQLAECKKRS